LPNKELRFLQISGKPVFALDGTFKGYRGTGTDITELRLREQQLAAERERLRRVTIEVSRKTRCWRPYQETRKIPATASPCDNLLGRSGCQSC
jgi:hypothetical protein